MFAINFSWAGRCKCTQKIMENSHGKKFVSKKKLFIEVDEWYNG